MAAVTVAVEFLSVCLHGGQREREREREKRVSTQVEGEKAGKKKTAVLEVRRHCRDGGEWGAGDAQLPPHLLSYTPPHTHTHTGRQA